MGMFKKSVTVSNLFDSASASDPISRNLKPVLAVIGGFLASGMAN